MEIKLDEEEVKRILAIKWRRELKKKLITGYKNIVADKELQKELEEWDKIEEEDINNDE